MKAHAPESYDEITRKTVLEPDGSVRPVRPPAVSADTDARLRDVVTDALIACGFTDIGVEVRDGHVILRGWVRQPDHVRLATRVVSAVAPDAVLDVRVSLG